MTGHKEGSHKAKKEPRMVPKKWKRVVTPDKTRPTEKLAHSTANALKTFQAAIGKTVPITLDSTSHSARELGFQD
jgi:hypothetical protein